MHGRSGILILCGDADGNLGDRAILTATCRAIRATEPSTRITVVSRDPERRAAELDVQAVASGPRGFLGLCRAALRSRVVLIGGGGLFQDDDSRIKMPYWAVRCWLARCLGARVVGHSLGVGPLEAPTSRWSARIAFAAMDRISVRDPNARRTAEELTPTPVVVVPDPAFMLCPRADLDGALRLRREGVPLDDGPLIGVAIRRWFPPRARWIPHRLASRYGASDGTEEDEERLLDLWAAALDRVSARTGARIVMLPTYNVAHEGDDRLCALVSERMRCASTHMIRIDDPSEYMAVAAQLAVMVGGRMHPTILAAAAGTPVVGLSYNPKFEGLFELLGVPDRCMRVEELVRGGDVERFSGVIVEAIGAPGAASGPTTDAAGRAETGIGPVAKALGERTRTWVSEVLASC